MGSDFNPRPLTILLGNSRVRFTVQGSFVDVVQNNGPMTTYGDNDMVLDNWGSVDRWIAMNKITTFGEHLVVEI